MKGINFLFGVIVFSIVFTLGINPSYGAAVSGIEVESMPDLAAGAPETPKITSTPAGTSVPDRTSVINFDDLSVPCFFAETTALRDRYVGSGVSFYGPGANDGGAILDECGNFDVSGYSSPNFLAFNTGTTLSDGGIPQGPEAIHFDPPVSQVQAKVGAGWSATGTITMEAYNAAQVLVDSDTVSYSSQLQTIQVQGSNITQVIVSFTSTVLVLDDLSFVQEGWETAYTTLFDSTSALELLRQYRDDVLSKSIKGKLYTTLLYESSEEALDVLFDNPRLMKEARYLIETNMDAVEAVLNGDEGTIHNTEAIVIFLSNFARKAPADLKLLTIAVKKKMLRNQEQGEKFLGFRLD